MGETVPFKRPEVKRPPHRAAIRRASGPRLWFLLIFGVVIFAALAFVFADAFKIPPSPIEVVDAGRLDKRTRWVETPSGPIGMVESKRNIPLGAIEVIDGDTIRAKGQTIRLVGFDTPEAGMNARCEAERTLAAKATVKLRQLVAGGGLDLSLVRCSCPTGTEGTPACNYGRACGVLTAGGKDVAAVLIADGLARPYLCSRDRCPRREPWC